MSGKMESSLWRPLQIAILIQVLTSTAQQEPDTNSVGDECWIKFPDSHITSGESTTVENLAGCQSACLQREGCQNIDFRTTTNGCWLHTIDNRDTQKGTDHYVLVCDVTNGPESPPPTRSDGCWTEFRDTHRKGGTKTPAKDLVGCKAACLKSSGCQSIDYNPKSKGCWVTISDNKEKQNGTQHYALACSEYCVVGADQIKHGKTPYIERYNQPGFMECGDAVAEGYYVARGTKIRVDECNECRCTDSFSFKCYGINNSWNDVDDQCQSHVCMEGKIVNVNGTRNQCDCPENELVKEDYPKCCSCRVNPNHVLTDCGLTNTSSKVEFDSPDYGHCTTQEDVTVTKCSGLCSDSGDVGRVFVSQTTTVLKGGATCRFCTGTAPVVRQYHAVCVTEDGGSTPIAVDVEEFTECACKGCQV